MNMKGQVYETYTEMRNEGCEIDVARGEHVELLQTGDGLGLDQGVGVVLHDGTAHQAVHPGHGDSAAVT